MVVACLVLGIVFGAFLEYGVVIDECDGTELRIGQVEIDVITLRREVVAIRIAVASADDGIVDVANRRKKEKIASPRAAWGVGGVSAVEGGGLVVLIGG